MLSISLAEAIFDLGAIGYDEDKLWNMSIEDVEHIYNSEIEAIGDSSYKVEINDNDDES